MRFKVGDIINGWIIREVVGVFDENFLPFLEGKKEVYIVDNPNRKIHGAGLIYLPDYDRIHINNRLEVIS